MARSSLPARRWAIFAIASLGALFLALAALGAALNAAHPAAGQTGRSGIALAVICGILAALLIWVAAVFEHRARHPHATSDPNIGPAWTVDPMSALRRPGRRGGFGGFGGDQPRRTLSTRRSPASAVFGSVVIVACAVAFWAAAVVNHSDAERSQRTQHASSMPAVVERVHVTRHETKSGHYYTTAASLQLLVPVDGRTATTLHLRGTAAFLVPSAEVTVHVDPKDPGYAELPRAPYSTTTGWVMMLGMAILFTALAAFVLFMAVRTVGQHRALRAAPVVV